VQSNNRLRTKIYAAGQYMGKDVTPITWKTDTYTSWIVKAWSHSYPFRIPIWCAWAHVQLRKTSAISSDESHNVCSI